MNNLNRLIKYFILTLVVALACIAIPSKKLMTWAEIGLIALVASSTFLILDTYLPDPRCKLF